MEEITHHYYNAQKQQAELGALEIKLDKQYKEIQKWTKELDSPAIHDVAEAKNKLKGARFIHDTTIGEKEDLVTIYEQSLNDFISFMFDCAIITTSESSIAQNTVNSIISDYYQAEGDTIDIMEREQKRVVDDITLDPIEIEANSTLTIGNIRDIQEYTLDFVARFYPYAHSLYEDAWTELEKADCFRLAFERCIVNPNRHNNTSKNKQRTRYNIEKASIFLSCWNNFKQYGDEKPLILFVKENQLLTQAELRQYQLSL